MISRLSHKHPVFDDENATCFNHLEEATHGTIIDATIQPFKRRWNGQGAWRAIIAHHFGDDMWEAEIKSSDDFLKTSIWKGNTTHSLERFMQQDRLAYKTFSNVLNMSHTSYPMMSPGLNTWLMPSSELTPGLLQHSLTSVLMRKWMTCATILTLPLPSYFPQIILK